MSDKKARNAFILYTGALVSPSLSRKGTADSHNPHRLQHALLVYLLYGQTDIPVAGK